MSNQSDNNDLTLSLLTVLPEQHIEVKIQNPQTKVTPSITRNKFKLLLQKFGEPELKVNAYLKDYDRDPNIRDYWTSNHNLRTNKPFVDKQKYELMMRKKKLSEEIIAQNLQDYDVDPQLAQLWLHHNLNNSSCNIM
jgi:hypothetical protein